MGLVVDLFEIDALGFDGIALGNERAREAGADQNQQQKIGADVLEQDWKQKRGQHSANLRERCRESSSRAANRNRKHLPCNQVGHGVGPDIGHEAEYHEAGKEQQGGRPSADVKRQCRKQQADGAADEAEDLKAYAAYAIRQQHGKDDSHNQQHINERRSLGRQNVALNEFGGIARMIDARADERRQDGGREDPDAVDAEILQKPGYRSQNRPV